VFSIRWGSEEGKVFAAAYSEFYHTVWP